MILDLVFQYPEALMKLQEKQGFCLLLDIEEADYKEAMLSAVFYAKDLDGFWQEIKAEDKLAMVEIMDNHICFAEEKQLHLELQKQLLEEQERRCQEIKYQQEIKEK